jgi:hypothetical protein
LVAGKVKYAESGEIADLICGEAAGLVSLASLHEPGVQSNAVLDVRFRH